MQIEIDYAANFLAITMQERRPNLSEEHITQLKTRTKELLKEKYENHWYEDKPMKGSAFRCINISIDDHSVDSVLIKAAEEIELSSQDLLSIFDKGLALWVDPNDVSCRLGKGAIFPIYKKIAEKKSTPLNLNAPEFSSRKSQPQRPRSTSPLSQLHNIEEFRPKQRSLTPPGFSSKDAGMMYEGHTTRNGYSIESLHKLWDALPNTSAYAASSYSQTPSSYVATSHHQSTSRSNNYYSTPSSAQQNYYTSPYTSSHHQEHYSTNTSSYSNYQQHPDSSYSFNQYSSYYNPTATSGWKKNYRQRQQQKMLWQDNETYQKYHWSRPETDSFTDAQRQVQEVF